MPKVTAGLLALSLLANLVAALVVGRYVAATGLHDTAVRLGVAQRTEADHSRLARGRFEGLPGAEVVFFGDSHVQHSPFSELVPGSAQRGIEGQTIADLRSWVDQVLHPQTRRLIVLVGTNDAVRGRSAEQAAQDYRRLIARARTLRPDVHLVFLTAPPVVGQEVSVAAVNEALRAVGRETDVEVLDLVPLLAPHGSLQSRYTFDGTHLTGRGYARIAPLVREAAGVPQQD